MSDDQKIWFIYLTDHHEGPFTVAEIAEKAKAGLVNGQSLAWKDGMPEWVAAETIPELAPAMQGGGAAPAAETSLALSGNTSETQSPTPAAAAEAPAEQGEVSLAQLLAQSQKSGGTSSGTVSGVITDSASVLSSMASSVQANTTITKGSVSIGGGMASPGSADPGHDEEVWTLKIGNQVSGLHSLRKLTELAAAGEIPNDAMLWHPGWSDFQPTSSVPQVEASRKQNTGTRTGITGAGGTKPGLTRTGMTRPGHAMSAQSNSALDADDEPTDTELEAPAPPGFKGILFRIHKFVEKRKRAAAKGKAAPAAAAGGKTMTGIKAPAKKGGTSVKRLAIAIGALVVVAGAGVGAFIFLSGSSIPASVEVSPSDREQMAAVVGAKGEEGRKLFLAQAVGTEDNPADPTAPKYYVATNLPEGTKVSLQVTGVPGTLVNRIAFDKTFTASVDKDHIATFEGITDEGKALWGEFNLRVKAEGAEPLEAKKRFIGLKGGSYQKRLATYKESVQADYDKEIGELREYITTLKNIQTEASKLIADYKRDWGNAALHAKINSDWANFTKTSTVLLSQLEAPVKNRQPGGSTEAKFHGRAFQDVGTTVSQLEQLVKAHSDRLSGMTPTANADEIDGLVQAGVQALEAWLAQAVAKTPFDGAKTPDAAAKPATPPPAATPSPAATPPAATTPAPATAPAPTPTAAPAPTPTGAH